jgi:hypothetical protein
VNTNPQPPGPDVLHALTVLCVAIAFDLEEMHANGAIDLEEWPNAKALVDAVNGAVPGE